MVVEAPLFKNGNIIKKIFQDLDNEKASALSETSSKKHASLTARRIFLKKGLLAVTKKDLCPAAVQNIPSPLSKENTFYISAHEDGGDFARFRQRLKALSEDMEKEDSAAGGVFAAGLRQLTRFQKMREALEEALKIHRALKAKDLTALALRRGLFSLYEITGKQLEDDVLDNLFKKILHRQIKPQIL